jgi:DegV family protein with EDD domain
MKLAIITDSTCDLGADVLEQLKVKRVPLYVHFQDKTYKDWLEISPADIIAGVKAGASTPSTSQPSPQDFEDAYKAVVQEGAEEILCLTISSELSGTYQSANLAREKAGVPVTVFDSRLTSGALGVMVKRAAALRDEGKSVPEIVQELERIKKTNRTLFTVASLEFLQKGGRIGKASALLGGLLNIKPILGLNDGKIEPVAKARGSKKALKEMVEQVRSFAEQHGEPIIHFLHVQEESAATTLRDAVREAGIAFKDGGVAEIGAVIAAHVGPGTYGFFMYTEA